MAGRGRSRSMPARERAVSHLRRLVARSGREGKQVLPPLADLAREAGVCYVTMWHAVSALKAEGVLHTTPRHRVSLVPGPGQSFQSAAQRAAPNVGARWRRTVLGIEQSIRSGRYAPGQELPDRKTLMRQWGVGYATLRKALVALADTGAIAPSFGRRFLVPAQPGSLGSSRVALIVAGGESGGVDIPFPLVQDRLRALEQACARNNVALDVRPAQLDHRAGDALGYLVWTTNIPNAVVSRLLAGLAGQGKPVSVLMDTEDFRLPPLAAGPGSVRVFSEGASSLPGRIMGRYLLVLGHCELAYISPFHGSLWSQRRLDGILAAYSSAGVKYRVHECTDETVTMQSLAAEVDHARRGTVDSPVWSQVRAAVDTMAGAVRERHGPEDAVGKALVSAVQRRSQTLIAESLVFTLTEPLLNRAIESRGTTAWVAANDEVAVACLEYLNRRGLRVPSDISLVSFDDSARAFERGITSYNFDAPALQNRMLSHILDGIRPGRRGEAPGTAPLEVEGFVSVRRSVGQVKRGEGAGTD